MQKSIYCCLFFLGFIFGVIIFQVDAAVWIAVLIFLACIGLLCFLIKQIFLKKIIIPIFWIGFVVGGMLVFVHEGKHSSPDLPSTAVTIQARVVAEPVRAIKSQQVVVQPVHVIEGIDTIVASQEKILILTKLYPAFALGQIIEFTGILQEPEAIAYIDEFGQDVVFDYQEYLAVRSIRWIVLFPKSAEVVGTYRSFFLHKWLVAIKHRAAWVLSAWLPEPHNALLSGLLWGARSGMSDATKQAFAATSTTHIIALSGFNVSLVGLALFWLAPWVGLKRTYAYWVVLCGIWVFVFFAGAESSLLRAGIMGSLTITSFYLGRPAAVLPAMIMACAAMLIWNPKIIRYDLGFQLSFLATIGVVYGVPVLLRWFAWIPNIFGLRETVVATIAATTTTFPIIAFEFHRISLIAVVANILVVPVVPIAMLAGVLFLVSAWANMIITPIFQTIVWFLLEYILRVVLVLSAIPYASIPVHMSVFIVLLYYLVLCTLFVWVYRYSLARLKRYI